MALGQQFRSSRRRTAQNGFPTEGVRSDVWKHLTSDIRDILNNSTIKESNTSGRTQLGWHWTYSHNNIQIPYLERSSSSKHVHALALAGLEQSRLDWVGVEFGRLGVGSSIEQAASHRPLQRLQVSRLALKSIRRKKTQEARSLDAALLGRDLVDLDQRAQRRVSLYGLGDSLVSVNGLHGAEGDDEGGNETEEFVHGDLDGGREWIRK